MASRDLTQDLKAHLIRRPLPDGTEFFSVPEKPLLDLALDLGESPAAVMRRCLRQGIWPERFRPQRGTYSAEDQASLLGSAAAVIGAGGLGGAVSLLLARTGVGRIIVCDGDGFDESNLNRQLLSNLDRLGINKALCAAEEISRINPVVTVEAHPVWADRGNLPGILDGAGVVVDCLDNMAARYQVEEAALAAGIPFVHGAVAGHEGLVMTVFPGDPGLKGLYGPDPAAKEVSAEVFLGVPTVIPSFVASFQVSEAVKVLLGQPVVSRGRLVHLDLSAAEIESTELF